MKRLLCLLAFAAAPLLADQWPVSDAQLGPAPGHRERPRIAAGANGFLAAWSDFRLSHDVWGTRFDASGRALGPVHVAANAGLLALASDGDGYLAVVAPADCSGIDAISIAADGTVGAPAHVADVLDCPLEASAASNGSSYLVVYSSQFDERMRSVLFDRDGKRLRGPLPLAVPHLGAFVTGSNGRDYLLVTSNQAISIDASGNAAAPRKIGVDVFSAGALAPHGDGYLLLTGAMMTQVLAADGSPAGAPHQLLVPTAFNVSLAWTGSEYVAAWTSFRPIVTTMWVARIAADGTLISRATTDSPPESFAPIDLASARGVTLMVRETTDQQLHAATIATSDIDADVFPDGDVISLSASPQLRPRMAALPSGAVIAWNDNGHLLARLLDGDGHPAGAIVEAGLAGSAAHHVVFDGANVVVATLHNDSHKIFAQRFTASLQPVDPQPVTIGYAGSATDFALAGANGVALFAWTDGKLWSALLAGGPVPQHVIASDNDQSPPAATWDGFEFLVAYSRSGNPALAAVRVNGAGNAFDVPRVVAETGSPAVRSTIAPVPGGVFAAWSNFGVAARIFAARSDLAGTVTAGVFSPAGVVEGPVMAGTVVAWTLHTDGGLQLQWRAGDVIVTLPPEPRLAALDPSIVAIGSVIFVAYERFDEAAGGVTRITIQSPPPLRHRASRQ
jgi:hypothetical protein